MPPEEQPPTFNPEEIADQLEALDQLEDEAVASSLPDMSSSLEPDNMEEPADSLPDLPSTDQELRDYAEEDNEDDNQPARNPQDEQDQAEKLQDVYDKITGKDKAEKPDPEGEKPAGENPDPAADTATPEGAVEPEAMPTFDPEGAADGGLTASETPVEGTPEFNPEAADGLATPGVEATPTGSPLDTEPLPTGAEKIEPLSELPGHTAGDAMEGINITTTGAEGVATAGAEGAALTADLGGAAILGDVAAGSAATATAATSGIAASGAALGTAASTATSAGVVAAEGAAVAGAEGVAAVAGGAVTGGIGALVIPLAIELGKRMGLQKALTWATDKENWSKLAGAALALTIITAFVLGMVFNMSKYGNPGTSSALAANANFNGEYCANIMQPTLDWKGANGKVTTLTLTSTKGRWSSEETAATETVTGGALALDSYRNKTDPNSPYYFPDSWLPYYAVSRWTYKAVDFHDNKRSYFQTKGDLPLATDFVGRRIIFYNPKTKKAVIGLALDWGPNPQVALGDDVDKSKQEQLWNTENGVTSDGYRITDPSNGLERIGGGPSTLGDVIGISSDDQVVMGFAPPDMQNHAPGPIDCSPTTAGSGSNPPLPADKGICTFCTQMPLPVSGPHENSNYGQPKAIILHYLGEPPSKYNVQSAFDDFNNSLKTGVNIRYVQFVVGQNGTIYQFLPETKQVAGAMDYNTAKGGITISIENEGNFEDGTAADNYTKAQVASNAKLVKYLMNKYNIPSTDVISHFEADCRAINLKLTPSFHRSDPGTPFMHAVLGALNIDNSAEEKSCTALKNSL